jgi:hypothetical protein
MILLPLQNDSVEGSLPLQNDSGGILTSLDFGHSRFILEGFWPLHIHSEEVLATPDRFILEGFWPLQNLSGGVLSPSEAF